MWENFLKKYCNDHSIIYTLFVIETIKAIILSLIPGDIDFNAYMEQAGYMDAGERDYSKISSKMGVMCYPAIHAYIHLFIYYITCKGTILKIAQLFSTIIHFINIYSIVKISDIWFKESTKRRWVIVWLIAEVIGTHLSSQYVFNDVYWVTFAHLSILWFLIANKNSQLPKDIYSYRSVIIYQLSGVFLMSLSISIKMNSMLYIPALYLIVTLNQGILTGTFYLLLIVALSLLYGLPFLLTYPKSYFSVAYNFKKGFDLVVSQNYYFLSNEIFTSELFGKVLLILHLILLIWGLFIKWFDIKQMFKLLGIYPFKLGIFSFNQAQKENFTPWSSIYILLKYFLFEISSASFVYQACTLSFVIGIYLVFLFYCKPFVLDSTKFWENVGRWHFIFIF